MYTSGANRIFIINFHGIGEASRPYDPGERPFWISQREFLAILDFVQSTSAAVDFRLTFDDGNSSDYEIAVPELDKRGLSAGFFVLAGKFGSPGHLTRSQARELVEQGFQVGSHGLNHIDWSRADDHELTRELSESKSILEDSIGREVGSAAIPFGRYDRRVLSALRRLGYQRVYSSDGRPRLSTAWPTPRYSVQAGIDLGRLSKMAMKSTALDQLRNEIRLLVKALPFGPSVRGLKSMGRRTP